MSDHVQLFVEKLSVLSGVESDQVRKVVLAFYRNILLDLLNTKRAHIPLVGTIGVHTTKKSVPDPSDRREKTLVVDSIMSSFSIEGYLKNEIRKIVLDELNGQESPVILEEIEEIALRLSRITNT